MGKIIGIDLGTTSARVAVMLDGRPVIIANSEGQGTTPSYVAITEDGRRIVGEAAKRYAAKDPANVAYAVKRIIGRRYSEPEVQEIQRNVPYNIVEGPDGAAWIELQGKSYSPIQLSAFVLQKMKATAEEYIGESVTEAVVTTPAYFSDNQRKATQTACEIAGLRYMRSINEPTASAMYFGLRNEVDGLVAVYDLGGGTFDVSILEIGDGVFECLSTSGDTLLGGEDFDYEISRKLREEFQKEHGVDLTSDPIARLRLKQASENAKIDLTFAQETVIDLPFITVADGSSKHLERTITRAEFENMIEPLLQRSLIVCEAALSDAGLSKSEIKEVLLVGGSTRIPNVVRALEGFFGQKPLGELRREDAVALGAAVQAGVLQGDVKDVMLLDIIPMSLGIETSDGEFTRFIDRNTTIPTKKTLSFSTAEDNQPGITLSIWQGEDDVARNNNFLGQFNLDGIAPAPSGVPKIDVTFNIDANAILSINARDQASGKEHQFTVDSSISLSKEQVQDLAQDAKNHSISSQKIVDVIETEFTPPERQRTTIEESTIAQKVFALSNEKETPSIFVSYAHEDSDWVIAVQKALSLPQRSGKIDLWVDKDLRVGDDWKKGIFEAIETANVAILILSQDFFDSDFILETELPLIFSERERRRLTLIPVLVRPCPYRLHDISKFQFFNSPERPLVSLKDWEVESELTRLALDLTATM